MKERDGIHDHPISRLLAWRNKPNSDPNLEFLTYIFNITEEPSEDRLKDEDLDRFIFNGEKTNDHRVHQLGLDLIEKVFHNHGRAYSHSIKRDNQRLQRFRFFYKQSNLKYVNSIKNDTLSAGLTELAEHHTMEIYTKIQSKYINNVTYDQFIDALIKDNTGISDLILDMASQGFDQIVSDLLEKLDSTKTGVALYNRLFKISTETTISVPLMKNCLQRFKKMNQFPIIDPNIIKMLPLTAVELLYTYKDNFTSELTAACLHHIEKMAVTTLKDIKKHLPKLWQYLIDNPYYVTNTTIQRSPLSIKSAICASTLIGAMAAVTVDLSLYYSLSSAALPNIVQLSLLAAAVAITVGVAAYLYARSTQVTYAFNYGAKSNAEDRGICIEESAMKPSAVCKTV